MHPRTPPQPPRWYVISLRPSGGHATLRRAAARLGAQTIALSPWRLRRCDDEAARDALAAALAAPYAVFTSPEAVRAAHALRPLRDDGRREWFAVGAGSAAALRRAGIGRVHAPQRMDSEGLLALLDSYDLAGRELGLITAPGGRGALTPALQARGARVLRADVYLRVPIAPAPRAIARLRALDAPAALALSSGDALQRVLELLPDDAARALRGATVLAASERLATLARELGFAQLRVAAGPRPRELLAAAPAALRHGS
ncbi:uroporphyrinogen-III synthase [Lysobacter sp. 5GHs7-4]|uniref:uroporphyrinogen-III synthase n=1 Tax=Lysobacter sp. 5GHs7-4 TaxID=2904253 RepID=UPI001E4E09D2|nr:uroporphyrinogen-III synthase [Lysobacter sp. 5GHs7-4]UHQ23584.1 uroporphyrinogen-III synthase [Lysobacter sp. 5GHs7-4]